MAGPIVSFRTLYSELEQHARIGNGNAYTDVLLPWQAQALDAMSVLGQYGSIEAMSWKKDMPDLCRGEDRRYYSCLEHLYALSRVSDLLLLTFQPVRDPTAEYVWTAFPSIQRAELCTWWRSLGMQEIERETFHPFYHEIVTVDQAEDPDEPISLIETLWPGFLLGHMLFCRAGVHVRGGTRHIRKELAECSRLYWTFARNNRRAVDDSQGWGHNSQWATDFRRDYLGDDAYYYNVDGEAGELPEDLKNVAYHINPETGWREEQGLTRASSIELLRHRCFVVTPEHFYNEDMPYFYQEPRSE